MGRPGSITPGHSDVFLSTYLAAISPAPAQPSSFVEPGVARGRKDTPAEGCVPPATSCPTPAAQPQTPTCCLWMEGVQVAPDEQSHIQLHPRCWILLSIPVFHSLGKRSSLGAGHVSHLQVQPRRGRFILSAPENGSSFKNQQLHTPRHVCPLLQSRIHQARTL